ncbi:MAG: hypothetical protein KDE56_28430 [Anaerolineales bacterium]|nr:hypothetical protein [Anaerolineales bacterium]
MSKFTLNKLQLTNIIAFVAVIVMNTLSNTLPLNGRSAGEISDALPSYFTPAGYTFSIWGLIYLALLGFTVYQALPAAQNKPFMQQIGWLFALSSAANVAWLFAWHYGWLLLSPLIMLVLLVTLILIYIRLKIGAVNPALAWVERLLVQFPFAIYLGWITVATIANIASVLANSGWAGFGIAGPTWSAIMMLVAVVVAGGVLVNRRSLAYAGVLVWALFGIRAAYPAVPVIATTAVIAALLIIALAILGYIRTRSTTHRLSPRPA